MTEKDLVMVLADPNEFKRLIPDGEGLLNACRQFPEDKEKLITQSGLLSDAGQWKKYITSGTVLCFIADLFPDHADEMIQKVLADPNEFKHLIPDCNGLLNACRQFPEDKEKLITQSGLLSDAAQWKKYITSGYALRYIANLFPDHADEMIQNVLADPNEFKRLIPDGVVLFNAFRQFPKHKEKLITQSGLLSDPAQWKKYITSGYVLRYIADLFPDHADEMIQNVLADPNEFKRLIQNDSDLVNAAAQFPTYKILHSKTISEALEKINKKIEFNKIRDISSTLGQASRDRNPLNKFSIFDAQLLIKITTEAADKNKISENAAEIEARRIFNKPSKI